MVNSKELKEKIIKELLPNLSVDPYGGYVDAKELSKKTYDSVEEFYFRVGANPENEPKSVSIDPGRILTQEDYKEISWAVVEDIKQHANEWKIEKEGEKLTVVKHVSGRKHYKEGFAPHNWGEWNEIEQALSQSQQQAQVEHPPNLVFSWMVLAVASISLLLRSLSSINVFYRFPPLIC